MYKEFAIGFDCRAMWLPDEEIRSWPQPEKESFLRPDVERMLTVSRLLWPSVFVTRNAQLDSMWVGTAPGYRLETPVEYRTDMSYWNNLEAMFTSLKDNKEEYRKPSWVIAITVIRTPKYDDLLQNLSSEYAFWKLPSFFVSPSEVDNRWTFLGYDVQEHSLFSHGLGSLYPEEIQQGLRERWGEHLNPYHLFTNQEQAILYSEWEDEAQPMIAPFWVYGLYLIQPFP